MVFGMPSFWPIQKDWAGDFKAGEIVIYKGRRAIVQYQAGGIIPEEECFYCCNQYCTKGNSEDFVPIRFQDGGRNSNKIKTEESKTFARMIDEIIVWDEKIKYKAGKLFWVHWRQLERTKT